VQSPALSIFVRKLRLTACPPGARLAANVCSAMEGKSCARSHISL